MRKMVSLFVVSILITGVLLPSSAQALSVSEQIASLLEQIRTLQIQIASLKAQAVALHVATNTGLGTTTAMTPPATPAGCAIPSLPVGTSTPSTYRDGKLKIVSTARSYVYHDGKRHIVITPHSYVEENGKTKLTITPTQRIEKEGKRRSVISCVGAPQTDATAPVLSLVGVSLSDVRASVAWTTNEPANGHVYYGTSSPLTLSSAARVSAPTLAMTQTLPLAGLSASTTYYYVVEARDAVANTATSSEQHFTTLPAPDTFAPIISAASVGTVASSSAQVSWVTNEGATSKVYFGTTTPFVTTSALSVSNSALVAAHLLSLTGLSASTTYSIVIESKDGAGNTATSGPLLFTTRSE